MSCGGGTDLNVDGSESEPRIVVPPTSAERDDFFALDVDGVGGQLIGDVLVTDNVGSMFIDGTARNALVYLYQPQNDLGYSAYQTLVIGTDELHVAWFHCTLESNSLLSIWYVGTKDTSMSSEGGSGSCERTDQWVDLEVELPAVDMAYPTLEAGYTFSGESLSYDGINPGTVTYDGVDMVLLPFAHVDCSAGCGSDSTWNELHALFYDSTEQRLCFGIFYMQVADRVDLHYTICLPDLTPSRVGRTYTATWSLPGQ
jgi:hypothetical protein